ncbi:hypothetical protein TIFTF001_022199 [Ficus carica]|uniref:Uncharacterized protein n=1 Tax=Ficus carica TaxID=3494 RepID=A0AA88AE47_FICCA|nr:hypothetical protein TIFTF001_022199 [Ficus carica]
MVSMQPTIHGFSIAALATDVNALVKRFDVIPVFVAAGNGFLYTKLSLDLFNDFLDSLRNN